MIYQLFIFKKPNYNFIIFSYLYIYMKSYRPILSKLDLPEYKYESKYKKVPKNIKYGNVTLSYNKFLHMKNPIFDWKEFLRKIPSPDSNNSNIVKSEIKYLYDINKNLTKRQRKQVQLFDRPSHLSFLNLLKANGIDEDKHMHDLINLELAHIIIKLKVYFQRPRAYQLAYYYGIDFTPMESYSAWTPSYPSGHGFQGTFYAKYYSWKYPHLKKKLMRFGKEYADSRIYGGYHYPSDNLVSNKIVDYFFKKKYHKNLEKNIKQKYY